MPRTVVVQGLRKSYGAVQAVREVSFTVEAGQIFALLGPNGAGKTTTLEVLEGFRARDAGHVSVVGIDPADRAHGRALRERIGLVLQDIAVEPSLTVRETIARNAGYYPAPWNVDEVIGLVDLSGPSRRQNGILKRVRATPLPAGMYFLGLLAHCVMVSVVTVALIIVVGHAYGVPLPWKHLGVLLIWGTAGAIIAIRRFRWDPRPE